MATGGILEDSKQLVECPQCHNSLTDARRLPCFHSMCTTCLVELIDAAAGEDAASEHDGESKGESDGERQSHDDESKRNNGDNGENECDYGKINDDESDDGENEGDLQITCPACSTKATVKPSRGVDTFPLATFYNSFGSALQKVLEFGKGADCSVCETKEQKAKGSWMCLDCSEVLCENCHFYHKKFLPSHKSHQISDTENAEGFLAERKQKCSLHDDKYIEYCCEDCQEFFCVLCYIASHKDHEVQEIGSCTTEKQTQLEELVEEFDTELRKCLETSKENKSTVELLNDTHKSIRDRIQRHAVLAKQQIEKSEAELLKKIDAKKDEWAVILKDKMDQLDSSQKQISQSRKYLKTVLEKGTETDICQTFVAEIQPLKATMQDQLGNRHKVPRLNLSLGNCSKLFDIPTLLLVDKMCEIEIPYRPGGMALNDDGHMAVCEHDGQDIRVFDFDGNVIEKLEKVENMKAVDITYNSLEYFVTDRTGFIHIYDTMIDRRINTYQALSAVNLGIHCTGDILFVATTDNNSYSIPLANLPSWHLKSMKKLTLTKLTKLSFTKVTQALQQPSFINVNENRIVISYCDSHQVKVYDREGNELFTYHGTGSSRSGDGELNNPWGVALDDQNCVFISDGGNKRVVVLSPTGKLIGYIRYCDGIFGETGPICVTDDGKIHVGCQVEDDLWKVITFSYSIIGSLQ